MKKEVEIYIKFFHLSNTLDFHISGFGSACSLSVQNQSISTQRGVNLCDYCGKSYRQLSNLNRHIKFECGKRTRFGCGYCEYRSSRRNTLKRHCDSKHQGKDFMYTVDTSAFS